MPMPFGKLGWRNLCLCQSYDRLYPEKEMIEKGFVNDDTQAIFQKQRRLQILSLKWALSFCLPAFRHC